MSQVSSIRHDAKPLSKQLLRAAMALTVMLTSVLHSGTAQAQTAAPEPEIHLPHPAMLGQLHSAKTVDLPSSIAVPQEAVPVQPGVLTPQASGATPTVAPISFYGAPYASDGGPDIHGNYPVYVSVSGDFGHKNHLDTVTFQDSTLNYMSNDGSGHFTKTYVMQNPSFYSLNSAKTADLDGDGYLDIVASSANPVGLMVFMNKGDGTFAPGKFTALPAQTGGLGFTLLGTFVNIADINKDGKMDIVASGYKYGTANAVKGGQLYNMFFAGNGDGTFQTALVNTTAYVGNYTGLRGVVLADTNNDGKSDLVAAIWNYDSTSGIYTVYLSTSFGDGTGNFTRFGAATATNTVIGSTYADATMQAIDLNNDGNIDILWTAAQTYIYTSLGNGDGTFQVPNPSVTAVNNIGSFTTGDFDRDGYPDIAVFIDGLVSVYQGLGNGSFSLLPISQYPNEIAGSQPKTAQDYNGDGVPDLLIANPLRNQLAFLKGNGDGTFVAAPVIIPQNPSSLPPNNSENADFINVDAAGNFFGDGKPTLLAEEFSGGYDYLDYAVQNGKNGFNFTRALNLSLFSGISFLEPVAGDFNGDGRDDFILALSDGIGLGLSNGDGTVKRTHATFPIAFLCPLNYAATGDINGDGKLDMVVAYPGDSTCFVGTGGTTKSGFFIMLGDGAGNFTTTYSAFGGQLYLPKLADLNHDGKLDLVLDDLALGAPTIYAIPGDGSGKFNPANAKTLLAGGGTQNGLLLNDFNGDGVPDLTVLQSGISGATDNRQKGILTMVGNGDFTFQAPQFVNRGYTGIAEAYADFNQDNLPDLVVNLGLGGITYGGLVVYPNLGNGTFGSPIVLQTPATSGGQVNNVLLVGDFNGDGAADIIMGEGDGFVPSVFYPNAAGNQLQLVAQAANSVQYNAISLSAATVAVGGQTPTGTVSFFSNGTPLGTAPLSNGIASIATTSLAVGTDNITAKYSGDALNYPSTSNSVAVNVTGYVAGFTLTPSTTTLSIGGATPAQMGFTLATDAHFAGTATFACQGLPSTLSCTFSNNQLTLAPGSSNSVQLTVSYKPQYAGLMSLPGYRTIESTGIALAGFLAVFLPGKRRRLGRVNLLMLWFGVALLAGLTGCSTNGAKPPFTGSFNVVASGTTNSTTVVQSVSVAYSVQP